MKLNAATLLVGIIILGDRMAVLAQSLVPAPTNHLEMSKAIGPRMQFETTTYDAGRIKAGFVLKHTFAFTNAGDQTLEITNVETWCGCTTTGDYERRIGPGKSGAIPLQFNTTNYGGPFTKVIFVWCNDTLHPLTSLQLKGTVFRPVDVTPMYVIFNVVAGAQTNETKIVKIINNQDQPLSVSEPICTNRLFKVELATVRAGQEFELRITAGSSLPLGYTQAPIMLRTSSTNLPVINLGAIANVQKPVVVAPTQISLPAGPLAVATVSKITIRNLGNTALVLSKARVNVPGVNVSIQEAQPGRLFNLAVNFPAGFQMPPRQKVQVTVKSNHPDFPVITVPVITVVRPVVPNITQPVAVPATSQPGRIN